MQELLTKGIGHKEFKKTEIGRIPKDWEVVRLGDEQIAEIKYGKGKPSASGKIPVIGSSGVYGWTNQSLIDKPTIVIGRKGSAGIPHLSLTPCWPSDTTFYLDLNLAKVNPKFLYEHLIFKPLSGEHAKTTLPSLKREDLQNFKFPLPPLSEQEKIAEILSTVDEKIEIERKRREKLERIKKSLMDLLLTGKIRVRVD
jgi:type I restriction enzyme S subunit